MNKAILVALLLCSACVHAQVPPNAQPKAMDAPVYQLGSGSTFDMSHGVMVLPSTPSLQLPSGCQSGRVQVNPQGFSLCGSAGWVRIMDSSQLGAASGLATLDNNGKLLTSQLPQIPLSNLTLLPLSARTGLYSDLTGTPPAVNLAYVLSLFGSGACSGYLKFDGTCGVPATQGGGTWGSITGTLASQTDLQSVLNTKQATLSSYSTITSLWTSCTSGYLKADGTCSSPSAAAWGSISGSISAQSDLQTALAGKQATISDYSTIVGFWTCVGGGYLKSDGTCATPSAGVWGQLSGTLSAQTDLQNALNAKQNILSNYATVVNLWGAGTCTGFLKSDGTCSTVASLGTNATALQGTGISTTPPSDNQVLLYKTSQTAYIPTTQYALSQTGCGTNTSGSSTLQVNIARPFRTTSGSSDTLLPTDCEGVVKFTASGGTLEVLPQAGSAGNWVTGGVMLRAAGGAVTVYSSGSTIDGVSYTNVSPFTITSGKSCYIFSDGTNWQLWGCN